MRTLHFTSSLDDHYREDLENLMYFNPMQERTEAGIVAAIEQYGVPKVVSKDGRLSIRVGELPEVQTLFALSGQAQNDPLAGILIYIRSSKEVLTVLHIGVKEEYSTFGVYSDSMLTVTFITRLREIARTIKGVRILTIMYGKGNIRRIPVSF